MSLQAFVINNSITPQRLAFQSVHMHESLVVRTLLAEPDPVESDLTGFLEE